MTPKLVFDGIFFQLANSGIARVWKSILREWSQASILEGSVILDRAKSCPRFDGFIYEDIPAYDFDQGAEDSLLLESTCKKYGASIFVSSYYTTPISVPSLMMVYDMIPEKFDFNLDLRGWREKNLAIRHASAFVSISKSTAEDLLELYPEIPSSSVIVAHCGVDRDIFYPRTQEEIAQFRQQYGIKGNYYLFVGSRSQTKGYKNSQLFFNSLSQLEQTDFSIVCVGGESELQEYIKPFTAKLDIHLVNLTDEELSVCYSDAVGLVYPSLYEGFGLPIIEAMACGCPVITTREGSIPEAAGDAAYSITGKDEAEMAEAIVKIRDSQVRQKLIRQGIDHASQYSWKKMADITYDAICKLHQNASHCQQNHLIRHWKQYRKVLKELQ
jgi:glycosyltransferase involved in cell wall biosynthesis